MTAASKGGWYSDSAIVFGVVVNGQARAYPKNMMEVHEMVNDTLGGRRIGMPYCTLCLIAPDGKPLAFPRVAVQLAVRAGEPVRLGGVEVRTGAGGLRAFGGTTELVSHDAIWFAWSEFKPGTGLWWRGRQG